MGKEAEYVVRLDAEERGKRGSVQFSGTARRVLRTNWTHALLLLFLPARRLSAACVSRLSRPADTME
jgi:hypothetical protein